MYFHMASRDELEQERQRIRLLLQRNSVELKRARRRVEVDAAAWSFPPRERNVAVALYHLAGCESEPVVRYLAARGRERGWPVRDPADLRVFVEDLYQSVDHAEIGVDEADPLDEGALAAALKCVSDWRVVVAARRANITTGVVPTDTMVQQVEELRQQMPELMGPPPLGGPSERRAKRWAARLRKTWRGRFRESTPRRGRGRVRA